MNVSCHTYEWVKSHIRMSHAAHMNESCHTNGFVKLHICMSQVTRVNESCHTYEWVMSQEWMGRVIHMKEPYHTYELAISHIWMSHVTHINESRHTHEWVMSHICCMSSQESQRRQYMYEINESCVSQEGTMRSMSHVHVTNSTTTIYVCKSKIPWGNQMTRWSHTDDSLISYIYCRHWVRNMYMTHWVRDMYMIHWSDRFLIGLLIYTWLVDLLHILSSLS